MYQALRVVKNIGRTLDFHKGNNVIVYDVSNKTPLARFYIAVSCNSASRVSAFASSVEEMIEKSGAQIKRVEGRAPSPWIVIDAYDIVVHVFSNEERERIKFDDIYDSCPQIDYSSGKVLLMEK